MSKSPAITISSEQLRQRVEDLLDRIIPDGIWKEAETYARHKIGLYQEWYPEVDHYDNRYLVMLTADTVRETEFSHATLAAVAGSPQRKRGEAMEIRSITLKEANSFVTELHRHHGPVVGHKWSIAAYKDGRLCGVAIIGRPSGRYLDNGKTLEVTRLCTDGTRNACSCLYAAAARRAEREGYEKIITFILQSEPGTSLKAAGWIIEAAKAGKPRWNRQRYAGKETQLTMFPKKEPPAEFKQRWAKNLNTKRGQRAAEERSQT